MSVSMIIIVLKVWAENELRILQLLQYYPTRLKNVLNKEKKRTKKLKRYNIDNYSTMSYIKKDNKYEKTFIEKIFETLNYRII